MPQKFRCGHSRSAKNTLVRTNYRNDRPYQTCRECYNATQRRHQAKKKRLARRRG
jgi:hypothetical protein